jgi:curved DNA-binding protein CbpA
MLDDNLYRILQVDPDADQDVIAAAYRVLAARLHPDRDITGVHEYRMAELNRAYAVLRDPGRRQEYDERLKRLATPGGRVPMGPGRPGSLAQRMRSHDADGLGEIQLDFGRYEGWTLGDLVQTDPDYLRWLSRHSSGIRYRGAILRLLAEHEGSVPLHVPR